MKFKDYLRSKLNSILVFYMGLIIMIVVMSLSILNSSRKIAGLDILYGLVLASLILFIFIYFNYRRDRKFLDVLKKMEESPEKINEIFNLPSGISSEYDLMRKVVLNNYSYYISELDRYEESEKLTKHFNNRWIHEMKTPVSVMKLIIEGEKDLGRLEEKTIASFEEEIDKLSKGLEMALYTLRINDFNMDFKVEEVNLTELVRGIINENKKNFILNSVFPRLNTREDIYVRTDKKWLRFVINQIIANSIKYTKLKDQDKKEIVIDIVDSGDLELIIRDNGIGINKGEETRIFEAFYTGKTGRKYLESTGMGLYLVKKTLDKLGHKITVESEEGQYSQFNIYFKKPESIYELD